MNGDRWTARPADMVAYAAVPLLRRLRQVHHWLVVCSKIVSKPTKYIWMDKALIIRALMC